jgi:hypothetical protein
MPNFYKNRLLLSGSTMTVLPVGDTLDRQNFPYPLTGAIRYNTDLASVEFYNGTTWINITGAGSVTYTIDNFTGNGITTTFTLSNSVLNPSQIIVFVGSAYQAPFLPGGSESAYTVVGNQLIFNEAPPINAAINVILTG